MKTALIINGAEVHELPHASGKLNTLLFDALKKELGASHNILSTTIMNGYDVAEEQRKYLQADLIIFQFPVFWFGAPSSLKRYIDDLYMPGVFFGHGEAYGRGGLLTTKRYMLSTTWNAKASDFNTAAGFLSTRTVDDVLVAFHLAQQYIGMQPMPTFSEHSVIRNADPEGAVRRLQEHVRKHV